MELNVYQYILIYLFIGWLIYLYTRYIAYGEKTYLEFVNNHYNISTMWLVIFTMIAWPVKIINVLIRR